MTVIKQTNIIDSVYVDVPKRDSSVCYEKITDNNFIDKTGKTHGIKFKMKPPNKDIKNI